MPGFNEAGAKSAGKPTSAPATAISAVCFNEAGAKSAGKPYSSVIVYTPVVGFNEAGAKSAGKPVVSDITVSRDFQASMRPAQKAPENACFAAATAC